MTDNPAELAAIVADASVMYYKRRDALKKLFRTDPALSRPLLDAVFTDKEKVLRRDAAEMLGSFRDAGAVALLVKGLSDEDSDVKRNAVKSLKAAGAPEALDALRSLAASDPSIFVRREAEEAIKALGGSTAPAAPLPAVSSAAPKPALTTPTRQDPKPVLPPWKSEPDKAPAPEVKAPAADQSRAMSSWKQSSSQKSDQSPEIMAKVPSPAASPSDQPRAMSSWKQSSAQKSDQSPEITAGVAAPASSRKPGHTIFDKLKPKPQPDASKRTEPLPPWKKESVVPVIAPTSSKNDDWRPPRTSGGATPPQAVAPEQQKPEMTRKVRKAVAEMSGSSTLCPKCQWVLKPGQRFCTFCGFAFEPASTAAAQAAPRTAEPVPVANVVQSAKRPAARPAPVKPAKSSSIGCAVAAAVIGAIMVIGLAAAAISGGDSKPRREPAVAKQAAARSLPPAKPETPTKSPARAPAKNAGASEEGRPVVMSMKNGQTVYAFLISETEDFYRVKMKKGIYNVPKSEVRKVISK